MFIHAGDVADDIVGRLNHPIRSGSHIPGQFRTAEQVFSDKKGKGSEGTVK